MTEKKGVKWLRRAVRALAVVVLALVAYLVIAPTGRYLLRGGVGGGEDPRAAPTDRRIIADPATPRRRFARSSQLVLAARAFAHDSLGLTTGESFTTYSRLDRDTLVLVLSGAYRDKLRARTWWFPVVGRVPYKGYFDFAAARAAERDLTRRDSTRGSARRRRSARLAGSTTRCCRPRSRRLADGRQHRHPRAHPQHVLRAGRRGLQRELRQLRRLARRGAVLPGARSAGRRAGGRRAVGGREDPGSVLGVALRARGFGVQGASRGGAGARRRAHRGARLAVRARARGAARRDRAAAPDDQPPRGRAGSPGQRGADGAARLSHRSRCVRRRARARGWGSATRRRDDHPGREGRPEESLRRGEGVARASAQH